MQVWGYHRMLRKRFPFAIRKRRNSIPINIPYPGLPAAAEPGYGGISVADGDRRVAGGT